MPVAGVPSFSLQCSIPLDAHTTPYLSILLMVDMWVDSSVGLTWDHQAFHWPWGEDPEGWVVRWDSHPPHLQSPPALSVGAADAEAAAAESASFVSASWLRQWLQRDLESSEEGARWNSVSASGGAVDSEGWGSRHFTSGRLWGPFVRLVSHQQAPSALARRGSNPKPFLYRISMNA